jgi:hypothetical protein
MHRAREARLPRKTAPRRRGKNRRVSPQTSVAPQKFAKKYFLPHQHLVVGIATEHKCITPYCANSIV